MARSRTSNGTAQSTASLGFEAKLWLAADKLRSNMDAAEYKHVVLGLIFLKYISDKFEEHRAKLVAGKGDYKGSDPEDADEYRAENVFWVPKEARWSHLQASAKQPTIGKVVDDAMVALERDNPRLKGVLPKDYARPGLDKHRLGELIDLIGTIGLGDQENRSKDILGRVYEYFLTQFASAEGKNGGQFYTPSSVVRLLVEMLAPYKGRIYDPACGSGGMFVQSEKFVEAHGGKLGDISIYGQESNATTRRLAVMNLALRGIEADFGPEHADTFRRDLHPDLRADYVLANPPFNDSDWFRQDDDVRWKFGVPPRGNANFAWVQHFIHHLAPHGMAGFVLANGSMSSNQSGEGDIRRAIIEADLVDCMVALPGQLFYSTQIPVCLWFLAKDKSGRSLNSQPSTLNQRRARKGETLFIDARKLGTLIDRVHRELTDADLAKIVSTYHAWRGEKGAGKYADVAGFAKSATTAEIAQHGHVLTPGRYVGAEEVADEGEAFDEKMPRLVTELNAHFAESAKLEKAIKANLEKLGYLRMKLSLVPLALFLLAATAHARLGETEQEMVARFGKPTFRGKHSHLAQGKSTELGAMLHFKQDDWIIQAGLIDGRCAFIAYGKRGEWTEEQIQLVLGSNSQGVAWTETTKGSLKIKRTWKRSDGATAEWISISGMKLVTPAYHRAKEVVEAKAKADASRKPKI